MKTLILTRHAKSSWSNPALSDHARPLSGRGRSAAPRIGAWLASEGHAPEEVLVSDAARTLETWERMAGQFPSQPEVRPMHDLYHAHATEMLEVLHTARAPCVMMIGHNPGIADFAARILDMPPDHPRFFDYPTAATTVMTFGPEDWSSITFGSGRVAGFMIPSDLPNS